MREQIEKLVQEELDRANAKFPQFASRHEGYAVLLEEVEEVQKEFQALADEVGWLWKYIKHNMPADKVKAKNVGAIAINLIEEAIQVAAMAKKYQALLNRHES